MGFVRYVYVLTSVAGIVSVDHSVGFGGKFGVQKDRVDDSAVGWDHHEKLAQHDSQKGERHENILYNVEC